MGGVSCCVAQSIGKLWFIVFCCLQSNRSSVEAKEPKEQIQHVVGTFFKSVQEAVENPYKFKAFHSALRTPYDYYKWYAVVVYFDW